MKTVFSYISVSVFLLTLLVGCNRAGQTPGDTTESTEILCSGDKQTEEHITAHPDAKDIGTVGTFEDFSVVQAPSVQNTTDTEPVSEEISIDTENQLPAPYVAIKEGDKKAFDAINWASVLENIPSDHYVLYPGIHGCPVTATLYKSGTIINLDVNDPRLVQMLNFYNNTIYHGLYSLTQGSYTPEGQESIRNASCRIELTYVPMLNDDFIENSFDLLIIDQSLDSEVGSFAGFMSDCPYHSSEGVYPSSAFGRFPLYHLYGWLALFGF